DFHRFGGDPAGGARPRVPAAGVGGVWRRDADGRAHLRRARGDVPQGGRPVRVPARGDRAPVRLPLRLDAVRRDSDGDDRRGRGRVRALRVGVVAAAHAGDLAGAGAVRATAIGAAMVGSLFSMDAWNNVGFASGELKQPERDLPFAMAVGVLVVTTLYLLANVAYLNVLPRVAIQMASTENHPPLGTAALQAMF